MKNTETSILFVCMGNICRSPTAEGVFRYHAADYPRWVIDSAGTHAYHSGEPADRRAVAAASARGYDLSPIRARPVRDEDFYRFDLMLAMDRDNRDALLARRPDDASVDIRLMLAFAASHDFRDKDVPDPYYGGTRGFERVLDLIEDATAPLIAHLAPR